MPANTPAAKKSSSRVTPVPVVATPDEIWRDEPDAHDYPAAQSYLSLLMPIKRAKVVAKSFTKAPIEKHPAKDLLRSAGLSLLPADDPAVVRDLAKVTAGQRLSPVLIVRGDAQRGISSVIADGFHRVCASYHLSENELIPCRIIDYPK
jgi:hypothetical protein